MVIDSDALEERQGVSVAFYSLGRDSLVAKWIVLDQNLGYPSYASISEDGDFVAVQTMSSETVVYDAHGTELARIQSPKGSQGVEFVDSEYLVIDTALYPTSMTMGSDLRWRNTTHVSIYQMERDN